ncbi:MAG: hypothetical protein WAM88_11925 [Nitrososphaeraceae archaeon]
MSEEEEKTKLKDKSHLLIDSQDNSGDSQHNNGDEEYLKSIDKDTKLQQQKQREIEQQNISPEEIMEEEERRQPQSTQEG